MMIVILLKLILTFLLTPQSLLSSQKTLPLYFLNHVRTFYFLTSAKYPNLVEVMASGNKLAGISLLTAIASSLCCITPIVALVAGSSGIASSFSWLEPARPYLIIFTTVFLGFAWYQKLKPVKNADCNCETKKMNGFMKSTLFLGIITLFSILMLTFPYYSDAFYSVEKTTSKLDSYDVQKSSFIIEGMTCKSCEKHVSQEILQLNGIGSVNVSYDDGNAVVEFDKTQTNHQEITEAINSTGYSVIETKKQ